jgi:hypothetical protein
MKRKKSKKIPLKKKICPRLKLGRIKTLSCSVADPEPGFGIQCLFDPWIRDPGWVKIKDPGSGVNNPDHIS